MKTNTPNSLIVAAAIVLNFSSGNLAAQELPTSFAYQGQLNFNDSQLDDTADFEFKLFDALTGGVQVGVTIPVSNVSVEEGVFSVALDFGVNVFDGRAVWLEMAVRTPHDPGGAAALTALVPRQAISAVPYALQTRGIHVADDESVTVKGGLVLEGTTVENSKILISSGSNAPSLEFLNDEDGDWFALKYGRNNDRLEVQSSEATAMVFSKDGKVGVGLSNPTTELEVNGTVKATAFVGDGSGLVINGTWATNPAGYFLSQGSVGVGTDAPQAAVHVSGTTSTAARIRVSSGNAGPSLDFHDEEAGESFLMTYNRGQDRLQFASETGTAMVIKESGEVGIGVDNPGEALEVNGTVKATAFVGDGSGLNINGLWDVNQNGDLYDQNSIGIGTDSPQARLHVTGGAVNAPRIRVSSATAGPSLEFHDEEADETFSLTYNRGAGQLRVDGPTEIALVVQEDGKLGLGTTNPKALLHVKGSGDDAFNLGKVGDNLLGRAGGSTAKIEEHFHVALFENDRADATNTLAGFETIGNNADGIAIKLHQKETDSSNNFVTFYNGDNDVVGRIESYDFERFDFVDSVPLPAVINAIGNKTTSFIPGYTNFEGLLSDAIGINAASNWYDPKKLFNSTGMTLDIDFDYKPGVKPSFNKDSYFWSLVGFNILKSSSNLSQGTLGDLRSITPDIGFPTSFDETTVMDITKILDFSNPTNNLDFIVPNPFSVSDVSGLSDLVDGTHKTANDFKASALESFYNDYDAINSDPLVAALEGLVCWGLNYDMDEIVDMETPLELKTFLAKLIIKQKCLDQGAVFGSKGADYAEYIEKLDPEAEFHAGQVIGLQDGKITLDTSEAEQMMVISLKPIILGNTPDPEDKDRYQAVAFLGQAPVLTTGEVEPGDYIVPTGNHDGYAVGVAPDELTIEHLDKIIGRSLEPSSTGIIDLTNVMVGVNDYESVKVIRELSERTDTLALENQKLREEMTALKKSREIHRNQIQAENATLIASVESMNARMIRLEKELSAVVRSQSGPSKDVVTVSVRE